MSEKTEISWADTTMTGWIGCEKVSPACRNCYAQAYAARFWPHASAWDGSVFRQPAATTEKLLATMEAAVLPRRVFVGSMTDIGLVAQKDPTGLAHLLSLILRLQSNRARRGRHVHAWMFLTKRPLALAGFLDRLTYDAETQTLHDNPSSRFPRPERGLIPGLWIGATVETGRQIGRAHEVLECRLATGHFLSCEPLLGEISYIPEGIQWVVAGGETGHKARPTAPIHASNLADLCDRKGIPFHWKAWGAWGQISMKQSHQENHVQTFFQLRQGWVDGAHPGGQIMGRVGAKRSGREIYGETHDDLIPLPHEK